ncbi:hypothetical protein B0H14DRAFT_3446249 [Mycena olivaceomarginata]|nr:hypothetical protein B0H14DRAFT_3446249 [Mycena olivaceomarginata]
MEESITTQRILRSRITNDTPISGFYGPGAWLVWLITLGMTHGHMIVAFLKEEDQAAEWDYDLIGAGGYIIAASIDLAVKSRAISQLGAAASESPLLPALICAERAVSIGIGSSLFTVVTSFSGGSSGLRRAGTATIPLLFALVATVFSLLAHDAISQTTPVLWCRLHNGIRLRGGEIPFNRYRLPSLDAPWDAILDPALFYSKLLDIGWGSEWCGRCCCIRGKPYTATQPAPRVAVHQLGYFPVTGISLSEMDQIAVFLGVAFIAGFRSFRRILDAAYSPVDYPLSLQHESLLLPMDEAPKPSSSLRTPQRRSTH